MTDKRFGAIATLACAATLGVASAHSAESMSVDTIQLSPRAGMNRLIAIAPDVKGAPLGSAAAAKLPVLKVGKVLSGGPDFRTIHLKHQPDVFPQHSPANDPSAAAAVKKGKSSLPSWSAQVQYGKQTYNFTMLGGTPLGTNAKTTKIGLVVVPLKFDFNNGSLDATTPIKNCSPAGATTMIAQSPIFEKVTFNSGNIKIGKSQFVDLFQRQNFWGYIAKNNPKYHIVYKASQIGVVEIHVNDNIQGAQCATGASGGIGVVDYNAFDSLVQGTLIPALSKYINPSVIPVFIGYDMIFNPAAGYHNAFNTKNGVQVYGVTSYFDIDLNGDGSGLNTETISHEMAEFTDDPFVNNATPPWGNIGQVQGCQANLEVGDPLTGVNWATVTMKNGYTYTVTDLANFSWFYRISPSFSANGFYTMLNAFSSAPPICSK
jgi:hypothetical protein